MGRRPTARRRQPGALGSPQLGRIATDRGKVTTQQLGALTDAGSLGGDGGLPHERLETENICLQTFVDPGKDPALHGRG